MKQPRPRVRTPEEALDPRIREFAAQMAISYGRHPALDTLSYSEGRRIVEEVRAPWRTGGPQMLRTTEHQVPVPGGTLRIRVYDPGPAGRKAALIYMHGGGFTYFSIDTHDRVMREYAARGGFAVIGVDYPLSPETKFPVPHDQIVALIHWLVANGDAVGVDGRRLVVGGDSAGANLSMAACLQLRDTGHPGLIRGMLLNYGGFASDSSDEASLEYGGPGFMLTRDEIRFFFGNYIRGPEDARNPLACPLLADVTGLPPAFLVIPECDVLTEQSHAMEQKLRQSGVPVRSKVYTGATHSFLEAVSIAPIAAEALEDGAQWVKQAVN